jgi:hypothetical protein
VPRVHGNGFAIHHEFAVSAHFSGALETTMRGIILAQVDLSEVKKILILRWTRHVVHGNERVVNGNDLNVGAFLQNAKHNATNAAETI